MPNIEVPSLGEWIAEAPYNLGLSSGFFRFFAHMGALEALNEAGMPPSEISGSSSGGFDAALYAAGLEPSHMFGHVENLRRSDFWDPSPGLGFLRGELFDDKLRGMLPVSDFEDCKIPAHISVFDVRSRQTDVIRGGDIAGAIRASCAVPLLFQPVYIDGRPKLDGGIKDHAGVAGLQVGDRILHIGFGANTQKDRLHLEFTRMASIRLHNIVRVTPFSLQCGSEAFRQAHSATKQALSQPVGFLS